MPGCMGSFESSSVTESVCYSIYLHGYVSLRIMRISRQDDGNGSLHVKGIPVCVSVTIMDGDDKISCNARTLEDDLNDKQRDILTLLGKVSLEGGF